MLVVFLVCLLIVLDELITVVQDFYGLLILGRNYDCIYVIEEILNLDTGYFSLFYA